LPAQVGEAAVARWSDRRTIALGCVVVGLLWLLMLAFVLDMIRQHDPAQAAGGVVALVIDTAALLWLARWGRRLVTVLTTTAVYLPAGRGPVRRIELAAVEAVAVVRTASGWAIWLWPTGGPPVRLLTPQKVFALKAQSRARPTADYWAQVAGSPSGRAASAIHAQAATQQDGSAGPLATAPPVAELLRRGPDLLSQDNVRFWSPTDERAPVIPGVARPRRPG
jgi:hypothetical protein